MQANVNNVWRYLPLAHGFMRTCDLQESLMYQWRASARACALTTS